MIKKLTMLIALLGIIFTGVSMLRVNAAATYINDSGNAGMWHRQLGDYAYAYIRYTHINTYTSPAQSFSNETNPSSHYINYENAGQFADFNRVLSNPDSSIYTLFEVYEKNTLTGVETLVYQGAVDTLKVFTFYADGNMYFRDQSNKLVYKFYGLNKAVKMRWVQVTNVDVPIANLPTTTGNPLESSGQYGSVFYTVDSVTHNLSMTINYNGVAYRLADRIIEDITFLQNVEKSYYYTKDNSRFIIFFYKDSDFLATNNAAKKWNGFATWNLTTNEIIVTNRAWILTYVTMDDKRDAYAYYYMPEIPVEDLLSVSLIFSHRYGTKNITTLWTQQYDDWKNTSLTLNKDEQTYQENLPNWILQLYLESFISTAASIMALQQGNPFALPLLLSGSMTLGKAIAGTIDFYRTGGIDQISQTVPDSNLRAQIEKHYSDLAGRPITLNLASNKLFKLYIGKFDKAGTNVVEFDNESFKYTEVSWVSHGTVYQLSGEHINDQWSLDEALEAPEEFDWDSFWATLKENVFYILGVVLGIVLIIVFATQGAFTNPWKFLMMIVSITFILLIVGYIQSSGFDFSVIFETKWISLRL